MHLLQPTQCRQWKNVKFLRPSSVIYTAQIQFAPCPFLLRWSVSPTWRWSAENAWSMTFNPRVLRGPKRCLSAPAGKFSASTYAGGVKTAGKNVLIFRKCVNLDSWMPECKHIVFIHILCIYKYKHIIILYIYIYIHQLQFGSLMFNFCHHWGLVHLRDSWEPLKWPWLFWFGS